MGIEDFISKVEENIDGVEQGSLKPDTQFRDLAQWDSMAALNIITLINIEYGVQIRGDDIAACRSIEDLFKLTKAGEK